MIFCFYMLLFIYFFFICVIVKVYRFNLFCRFLNIVFFKVLNYNYCIGKLFIKYIWLIDVCNIYFIWCMLLLMYVWWFIEFFFEEWYYIELFVEDWCFSKIYFNIWVLLVIDGFYMWIILIKIVFICIY